MSSRTFQHFSGSCCKIHFENLDQFVAEKGRLSTGNLIYALERFVLGHRTGERFDIVLTWDLFNYLPLDAVAALLRRLQQFCKPGTLVHSVNYLSARIPEAPRRFSICDEGQLDLEEAPLGPRRLPRHSAAELLKALEHYSILHTYCERPGMQPGVSEQVFRYEPDSRASTVVAEARGDGGETSMQYHSPMFGRLLARLRDSIGVKLLDLGGEGHRALWLREGAELEVVDLYTAVEQGARSGSESPEAAIRRLLGSCVGERKFDVVIAWDLLNHLSPVAQQVFAHWLAPLCRESTQLLALDGGIAFCPRCLQLTGGGVVKVELSPGSVPLECGAPPQLPGFCGQRIVASPSAAAQQLGELLFQLGELPAVTRCA
ncbi:hypothetical protein [Microbulbifer taiwanensis]